MLFDGPTVNHSHVADRKRRRTSPRKSAGKIRNHSLINKRNKTEPIYRAHCGKLRCPCHCSRSHGESYRDSSIDAGNGWMINDTGKGFATFLMEMFSEESGRRIIGCSQKLSQASVEFAGPGLSRCTAGEPASFTILVNHLFHLVSQPGTAQLCAVQSQTLTLTSHKSRYCTMLY